MNSLKNIQKKLKWNHLLIFGFYFVLVACPLWGQVKQTKQLTVNDYKLWSTLHLEKASKDGQWTAFTLKYQMTDTLFIKNVENGKTYIFPKSNDCQFNSGIFFASRDSSKTLTILNLKNGSRKLYPNTSQYTFSKNNKYLLLIREEKTIKNLDIITESGLVIKTISGVQSFIPNDYNNLFICNINGTNDNSVLLLNLEKNSTEEIIIRKIKNIFSNFTWDSSGQTFAFMEDSIEMPMIKKHQKIYHYQIKNKILNTFNVTERIQNGDDYQVKTNPYKFKVSNDGNRIFFGVTKLELNKEKSDNEAVELWNGNDYWLYPRFQSFKKSFLASKFLVWHPKKNKCYQITSDDYPLCYLSGTQKFAVTFNPVNQSAEFKSEGDRTLFSVDLDTKATRQIIKNHSADLGNSLVTPGGKYLVYFEKGSWLLYNFKLNTLINITQKITTVLYNHYNNTNIKPYGIAGCTDDDGNIYVYDQYDIWKIKLSNLETVRLTKGRELNICYRLAADLNDIKSNANFYGQTCSSIQENELLLKAVSDDHSKSGYFLLQKSQTLKKIVFEEGSISDIIKIEKTKDFLFFKQKYDLPPALMIKKLNHKTASTIFQSNPHYQRYKWGHSTLIKYKNSDGESLKAALFYPANYNASQKYPMIVYIYQNKSDQLHQYVNPTQFDYLGFTSSNYTGQGYFVLFPDINYKEGKPAESATDCVTSAVQEVISQSLVDSKKIGLIGHSFGGYETNSIITKSNLFAAAVSGSGIADLTSYYLSVGAYKKSEIWRIENDQWQMNKSFYEDQENYNFNSPVMLAKNIATPLLIWTGKADKVVNWTQSLEMYLALKRLNKKTMMLAYPNEMHYLMKEENQLDLCKRIQDWFDYFLKDKRNINWIKNGV